MDKTPQSIPSSCNNDDGVPEATGMEKVLSDLNALKKLYGLLQRLDETSRALLKKLLDDATRKALLKQANALSTASDSVIPFSLGLASPKKMDEATSSSSSFFNNNEAGMEQILSDLQALTRLYSLLHTGPADENLDEASRALLMKILEDATQEAVRRQAKMLSGSLVPPALERKLSTRSDCRTPHADPRPRPVASPRPSILAREQSPRLNLQHSTVSRRSGLHVDGHRDAAEEPPLARLASKRSTRTALAAPARHCPSQEQLHSSLSLHRLPAAGASRHGTVTGGTRLADHPDSMRRSSGRGDQWSLERSIGSSRRSSNSRHSVSRRFPEAGTSRHGMVTGGTRLADRRDSIARSSVGGDQWSLERSGSSSSRRSMSHRFPAAATSRHGTVTEGTWLADFRDSIRRSSVRGDHWSLERSGSSNSRSSSSRRSVSRRELSLGTSSGCATPRHVEAESSSSARRFERQDSWLSVSTTSRHGAEHDARRGAATPECSSSSNTVATIQSRIRPSNSLLKQRRRSLRRRRSAAEKGRASHARHVSDGVSSADMYSSSMSSGIRSRSSWGAASLSASTSPTASPPPPPRAYATPYYYAPPPVMAPRGIAPPPAMAPRGMAPPPVYAPAVSRSMRRRRRQEILQKRVERLRMLKDKIATVFHHRHDHHHLGGGQHQQAGAGPSSRSVAVVRGGAGHVNSPWQFLTGMFHHAKEKVKNTRSRAVAGVRPEKRRGGGGGGGGAGKNMHALFDAVRRHLKSKRRAAPAAGMKGMKLRRKASRVLRAKKMHWWQRLKQRRGMAGLIAGSKPRRRLGHGKAGWL